MFLHVSVILFTGGVSVPACTTGHMTRGGLCAGGGGLCPGRGVSAKGRGVSVQGGGSLFREGSLSRAGHW